MSKDITTASKQMLYIQLPLNTALWGAKSWTLTADNNAEQIVISEEFLDELVSLGTLVQVTVENVVAN
jgi:hypothetical protein